MMNQGMMQQQPMPNQIMQNNPQMQNNPGVSQFQKKKSFDFQNFIKRYIENFNIRDKRSLVLLIPIVMVVIILVVVIFTALTTKTLKCNLNDTDENGIKIVDKTKVKFRFGHISSRYEKMVLDFSKSDVDNDTIESYKKKYKEYYKTYCKSSDGCTYKYRARSKTITVIVKNKYDKDKVKEIEEYIPSFEDYKDIFNDSCKEDK
jgi:hypothetical protein